ncbi:hypothetical protein [Clostridium aminobutyricum]|uniref:Uncharacterized protein n=1 Tax=Clostridium aminobutyricum TaxID=33953 RepID=A0A939II63_CLOAM|nr:hypothetical protein [Clostridium aminobutyricum]MBN7774597.1 hypothetical protein [Clostridium aminobutyricum]
MLRKRFSTTLLALVVAAAIPGSAFAADVASKSTGQVSAPATVLEPISSDVVTDSEQEGDAVQAPEGEAPSAPTDVAEPPTEVTEPTTPEEVTEPDIEVTEPVAEPQIPAVEEQPAVEPQPEEEVTVPETPAVEPEILVPTEEQLVTAPAIVVEEVVTEPAIVVESVLTTLTITHLLKLDFGESVYTETIEGVELGTEFDITPLIDKSEDIKLSSDIKTVQVDELDKKIILEYEVIKKEKNEESLEE